MDMAVIVETVGATTVPLSRKGTMLGAVLGAAVGEEGEGEGEGEGGRRWRRSLVRRTRMH